MLEQLVIENFAIIDQVELSFDDRLTVLTGETGAGKSIIIDALDMLTGGRANTEMIRKGADKSILQAVFSLDAKPKERQESLKQAFFDAGIDVSDDQVVIYREFNQKGRSVSRINGVIVPLKTLAKLGARLVEIQGQHDTSLLLNPDSHLALLDDFADKQMKKDKEDYEKVFASYKTIAMRLKQVTEQAHDLNQRLDLLTFQSEELKAANLRQGEEEELLEERTKLANYKKIADSLDEAQQALNPGLEGGAIDLLAAANSALSRAASFDKNYDNLSQSVSEAYYAAQDAGRELDESVANLSFDESALVKIDDRLQVIHQLKRKYGDTVEEILAFQSKVEADLATLDGGALDIDQLTAEKESMKKRIEELSKRLRSSRKRVAKRLENAVNQELTDLLMKEAFFEVHFEPVNGYLPSGADRVTFNVQTNKGEGVKSLEKAASGGEASRLMLALKTVFIAQQGLSTVVFDEIDTGVSGRVGSAIAEKMRAISEATQVLAITHLPQVAAAADHHFLIEKHTEGERTVTEVTNLAEKDRDRAVAMMLSGNEVTEAALANAHELRKAVN